MRLRRSLTGLVSLLALVAGTAGCSDDAGELVVIIQSDLSLPKDIDTIRLEVFNDGVPKFKSDYERLGEENQPFLLPGTITLLGSEDPADTIRVVASARRGGQDGTLRIVREVFTTVPQQRTAALDMPLQFLCDDSGTFDPAGEVTSDCPEDLQTCIAGTCQDATIDSATLPDYSSGDVYQPGLCLDVKVCFNTGIQAAVDTTDCSIDGASDVNVALETEGDGICGGIGCFVALDAESTLGWVTREDGRIQLPTAVCDRLDTGEVVGVVTAPVTADCPFKAPSVPTCGPWSAAGLGEPEEGATVLAGGQDNPVSIAVGNGALFWTNAGTFGNDGSIKAIDFLGGSPAVIAEGISPPRDILAMPNGDIMWAQADDTGMAQGAIVRFSPGSGMDPEPIQEGLQTPEGLAVRGDFVYWTEFGEVGGIYRANLTGMMSTPQLLAQGYYPFRIAVDDEYVYWTNEGLLGSMPPDGRVERYPVGGGPVEIVADAQPTPRGLVLDVGETGAATALYWSNFSTTDGAIMRLDLTGGTPGAPEVVVGGLSLPYGITLNGDHVYWTNRGDGTVMRASKGVTGATPELIAENQANPGTIAVDDTSVYWISESTSGQIDGALVRVPKPN